MLFFEVKIIPDLSLNKYQSLSSSGIEGVLEKHKAFLRQWNRIGFMGKFSFHLFVLFNKKRQNGQKMELFMLIRFSEDNDIFYQRAKEAFSVSPLAEFFQFERKNSDEMISELTNQQFSSVSMLYKKERFLKPIPKEGCPEYFYIVPTWQMEEAPRLYNMFQLMRSFDDDFLYRVDLYPQDLSFEMHDIFDKLLDWLRINFAPKAYTNMIGETEDTLKDPNAEETLKQYEDFLKQIDTSPMFFSHVSVFAKNAETSAILLDAAASEALSEGYNSIDTRHGKYDGLSFIDKVDRNLASDKAPSKLKMLPNIFSLEDIAPFFRLPVLYDGETIEIPKETAPVVKNATKDTKDEIYLGKDTNNYDVELSSIMLKKHMFVCGVPGAGKTNTMLHLASTLWKEHKIPFLVLEPAKKEYRELALFDIPELLLFSPSSNTKFPIKINPFEFPIGLTLSEHISKLGEVFVGSFPLAPPVPFILDSAIESCYKLKGWDLDEINMGRKPYPTVGELYKQFEHELENTSYDGELKGNIRSALEMRIGSLLRREMADIFDNERSSIKPEELITKPIIIELESLGENTANFITLLICTLIRETLKVDPMGNDKKKVRHIIFIEEAHNLIAPTAQTASSEDSNPKIAATAYIVKMLAEVRALREGIIIADQLPTAMPPEVIKNTNVKLVHRLTAQDDRGLIGGTMSANELQMEKMATFIPGQALLTYEGLLRPFEIRVQNIANHGQVTPNDEELYLLMKEKPSYIHILKEYYKEEQLKYSITIKETVEQMKNLLLQIKEMDLELLSLNEKVLKPLEIRKKNEQLLVDAKKAYNRLNKGDREFIETEQMKQIFEVVKKAANTVNDIVNDKLIKWKEKHQNI